MVRRCVDRRVGGSESQRVGESEGRRVRGSDSCCLWSQSLQSVFGSDDLHTNPLPCISMVSDR
jgi:hypothetical protein